MSSVWTEDRISYLKHLHSAGHSCSVIAGYMTEVGVVYFTRNAIIGKLSRLGIKSNKKIGARDGAEAKKITHAERRRRQRDRRAFKPGKLVYNGGAFALADPKLADGPRDLRPDESPDAISLLQVKDIGIGKQCRWPLGDPSAMMFCGSRMVHSCSYCARHARLAFQKYRGQQDSGTITVMEVQS